MDLARELLEIAERDLEASRLLYKNKLYPQAVFCFAQSVEKANKSLATLVNDHSEKYLSKKIGHESIIIHQKNSRKAQQKFNKILERSEKQSIYKELPFFQEEEIKDVVRQSDKNIQTIDVIREQRDYLLFIKATDINQWLKEIEDSKYQINEEMKALFEVNIDKDEWLQNINEISEILSKNNELKEASLKFIEDSKKIDFDVAWEVIKHYYFIHYKDALLTIPLYYLSIITLPLSNIARYPENGKSPLKIFTRKLPLVRKLPNLIEVHSEALIDLREFHAIWNNMDEKFNPDTLITEN